MSVKLGLAIHSRCATFPFMPDAWAIDVLLVSLSVAAVLAALSLWVR